MHQVFRMDSNLGGLIGFLVLVSTGIVGLTALCICASRHDFRGREARIGKICAGVLASYVAVVTLVAMLTPRTIVAVGDGYCWDLWCAGIEKVDAVPEGANVRYTARVRLFSDANHVPTSRAKKFLSAVDDQGRRFRVFQDFAAVPLDVAFGPKDSVETSLSFIVPANTKKLYLTGDEESAPWVYLYFDSDLNPLHKRTLLRVL